MPHGIVGARADTHLRYLFVREQQGKKPRETPAELHTALRNARPREYTSAGRIGELLADRFGWAVSTDEVLYLALHVSRLVDAACAALRPAPGAGSVSLAEQLLALVGGAGNVAALTRCWARLRFELRDPGLVDEAAVSALPQLAIAVTQSGQYQVALRSGLLEVFDELTALLRSAL